MPVVLAMTGLGRPDVGDAFIAEVGKGDDIVGAGLLDLVDGVLHDLIQRRTVIVFAERIDVVAVCVLEVGGGGLQKDSGVAMPM